MVNQFAIDPGSPGGTRHFSLARELVNSGHDVTIIACNVHYATGRAIGGQGTAFRITLTEGVRFLWLSGPTHRGGAGARLITMLAFAARLWLGTGLTELPRPDVIVGSSPSPFAALAAERLAARRMVPFVLEIRDLWPETLALIGGMPRLHPLYLLFRAIEGRLYRRASRLISVLPHAEPYYGQRGVPADRVVVIPNGYDFSRNEPVRPPPQRPQFRIYYAGAHGIANGLETIIEAAAVLSSTPEAAHIHLILVGNGPLKPLLQQRVHDQGLKNVEFRDPVPKSEIAELLADANAFIMSTLASPLYAWGGSPNKVFDYLAMGRPIIKACGAKCDIVRAAGAGICVPSGDAVAMAAAIRQLAATPQAEREAMGARGRRYVLEHHDMRMLAKRLEMVLMAETENQRLPQGEAGAEPRPGFIDPQRR